MMNHRVYSILLKSCSAIPAIVVAFVPVQAQGVYHSFNIPPQKLAQSLRDIARVGHAQITFDGADLRNRRAPALRGNLLVRDAISQAIAGQGLSVETGHSGIFIVKPVKPVTPVARVVVQAEQANVPAAGSAAAEPEAAADEVVVTGSRVRRPNETQATPVSTLSAAAIQGRGVVNIQDALNTIPAVGANTLSPSGAPRNTLLAGLFTVDLRSLSQATGGSPRTLVLVDSRRYVSSLQGSSAVDISTIPTDLIDRVEVTTGGGSAVYGSDAIAGVVNFVLNKKFQGVSASAQMGVSSRGDGGQGKISLLAGGNFAEGRGNATVYLGYDNTDAIMAVDRDVSADGVSVSNALRPDLAVFGPASYSNIRTAQGVFDLNTSAVSTTSINRTVLPNGTVTTPLGSRDGINPNQSNIIVSPMKRYLFNGRAHYDLTDNLSFFVDATYARNDAVQQFEPTFITSGNLNIGGSGPVGLPVTIPTSNPFVPAAMLALVPAGRTEIAFSRDFPEFGPRTITYRRQLYRAVAGVDGKLPALGPSWTYEIYGEYGRTTLDEEMLNGINTQRFYQSVHVVPGGAGGYQCADATARALGCVPVNMFTGAPLTATERAWLGQSVRINSYNQQEVVAASATGSLFELPGGPLGLAFGAEYRRESSDYEPDANLRSGLSSLQYLQPTKGSFDVKEVYGELTAPLLKDVPFAHVLEVEGAYRYADYSSVGGVSSWKIGGNYAPIRDIRFRAVYSRDVRAPTINDLYRGATANVAQIVDPCAKGGTGAARTYCLAQPGITTSFAPPAPTPVRQTVVGNSALGAEVANTLTAGAVFMPSFIPGLTISADYYEIKIKNAITSLAAQQIVNQCALTSNPIYCSTVGRDPTTGIILTNNVIPVNGQTERMRGVDVEVAYRTSLRDVFGARLGDTLDLQLDYTNLISYEQAAFAGAAPINLRGQPFFPEHKGNLNVTYSNGGLTASLNERYIGKVYRVVDAVFAGNVVPAYWYTDLQLRYKVNKNYAFYIGANNLFDKAPPFFPTPYIGTSTGVNTSGSVYNIVGRFLYAGASVKF